MVSMNYKVESVYIHVGGLEGLMCVKIENGERKVVLLGTCMTLETIDYMPKMIEQVKQIVDKLLQHGVDPIEFLCGSIPCVENNEY